MSDSYSSWGSLRVEPTLTIAEMEVVVEEAHRAKRNVAAHATTPEGIRNAVRAGVDSIEHPLTDRIAGAREDDRNLSCCLHCRTDTWRAAVGKDDIDLERDEFGCKLWKTREVTVGVTLFENDGALTDPPQFTQCLSEDTDVRGRLCSCRHPEDADANRVFDRFRLRYQRRSA